MRRPGKSLLRKHPIARVSPFDAIKTTNSLLNRLRARRRRRGEFMPSADQFREYAPDKYNGLCLEIYRALCGHKPWGRHG